MQNSKHIDHNKSFDFGKTSEDYGKFRDIYPPEFYERIIELGLCKKDQKILDIGTGTGVLPRNLYSLGAHFTGADIAENQIEQARQISKKSKMDIEYLCSPAEDICFPRATFDVVMACQCFTYFNHEILAPHISDMLKPDGKFAVMYMAWLPFEDKVAGESENLVLKYNPEWTGCREERRKIGIPDSYHKYFTVESEEVFDVLVPFTRESWNGRMRSCRGIGATLSEDEIMKFDREHMELLQKIAKPEFDVLHYCAISVMKKK